MLPEVAQTSRFPMKLQSPRFVLIYLNSVLVTLFVLVLKSLKEINTEFKLSKVL